MHYTTATTGITGDHGKVLLYLQIQSNVSQKWSLEVSIKTKLYILTRGAGCWLSLGVLKQKECKYMHSAFLYAVCSKKKKSMIYISFT